MQPLWVRVFGISSQKASQGAAKRRIYDFRGNAMPKSVSCARHQRLCDEAVLEYMRGPVDAVLDECQPVSGSMMSDCTLHFNFPPALCYHGKVLVSSPEIWNRNINQIFESLKEIGLLTMRPEKLYSSFLCHYAQDLYRLNTVTTHKLCTLQAWAWRTMGTLYFTWLYSSPEYFQHWSMIF